MLIENGDELVLHQKGEEEPPDCEAGQEDDELPEDEDKIAKRLDAETSSNMVANGNRDAELTCNGGGVADQ